jgi:hypothetical protein
MRRRAARTGRRGSFHGRRNLADPGQRTPSAGANWWQRISGRSAREPQTIERPRCARRIGDRIGFVRQGQLTVRDRQESDEAHFGRSERKTPAPRLMLSSRCTTRKDPGRTAPSQVPRRPAARAGRWPLCMVDVLHPAAGERPWEAPSMTGEANGATSCLDAGRAAGGCHQG